VSWGKSDQRDVRGRESGASHAFLPALQSPKFQASKLQSPPQEEGTESGSGKRHGVGPVRKAESGREKRGRWSQTSGTQRGVEASMTGEGANNG
jgi:hypothetical protein